jgi:cell division protein FtsW (lipid II flippase)
MSATLGRSYVHLWLLGTVLALAGLGLVNLSSAARDLERNMALIQAVYLGIGTLLALLLAAFDYRWFDKLAYPLFVLCLVALLSVLVFGRVVSGSRRWFHLGPFNLQPSELAKIGLMFALARYFSEESELPERGYSLWRLIKPATPLYPVGALGALILFWEKEALAEFGGWRFVLMGAGLIWAALSVLWTLRSGRTRVHDLLSPVILILAPAILVMRQPDLGTALALCAIGGTMILFMKVRPWSLFIALVGLVASSIAAWFLVLQPYQKSRILSFLAPGEDSLGSGYHALQSLIAVGSGQWSGKGYGQSTQTQFHFLPEQHTDFVFSVWAEEQGFVGCLLALGLFLALLVQLVNVASGARERFGTLVCVGLAGLFFWQAFINIGMVIGALPVVGITLPLWSYGGSSVLAVFLGAGVVLSVSLRRHAP